MCEQTQCGAVLQCSAPGERGPAMTAPLFAPQPAAPRQSVAALCWGCARALCEVIALLRSLQMTGARRGSTGKPVPGACSSPPQGLVLCRAGPDTLHPAEC